MFPKFKRLTGKDIQYMLRRGNKRRGNYFGVLTIPQYPNNKFHQISVQIPVKLDKRATMRNELRRVAREVFKEFQIADDSSGNYKKRFIFINKKTIDSWGEKLIQLPKLDRKIIRKTYCEEDFKKLKNVGTSKHSDQHFSKKQKPSGSHFQKRKNNK